jgi:hypothetical protein
MTVEGQWVDRIVGLDGVRSDVAMMRTPDGHGRLELDKFHTPMAVRAEPEDAPVNTLGIRGSHRGEIGESPAGCSLCDPERSVTNVPERSVTFRTQA